MNRSNNSVQPDKNARAVSTRSDAERGNMACTTTEPIVYQIRQVSEVEVKFCSSSAWFQTPWKGCQTMIERCIGDIKPDKGVTKDGNGRPECDNAISSSS